MITPTSQFPYNLLLLLNAEGTSVVSVFSGFTTPNKCHVLNSKQFFVCAIKCDSHLLSLRPSRNPPIRMKAKTEMRLGEWSKATGIRTSSSISYDWLKGLCVKELIKWISYFQRMKQECTTYERLEWSGQSVEQSVLIGGSQFFSFFSTVSEELRFILLVSKAGWIINSD